LRPKKCLSGIAVIINHLKPLIMAQETIQFIGLTPEQFKEDFLNEVKSFTTDLVQNLRPQESETYLSRKQVAEFIGGISIGTVINWSKKGILTEHLIGRLVRYKKSEVENAFVTLNS
jgi:hypothetical protein